jgi:tetratricopeptide (TPR) repeat protein
MNKFFPFLILISLILIIGGCGGGTINVKESPAVENHKTPGKPTQGNITAATEQLKEAKMFYARDKYKQALQHCEKAIEFDNRNWEAYYYLGLCMQKRRDFAEAAAALKRGLQFSPDNRLVKSEMHAAIGYCWENLKQFEDARKEYDISLSYNPANQAAREGQNRIKVQKTMKNWGKDKDIEHEG